MRAARDALAAIALLALGGCNPAIFPMLAAGVKGSGTLAEETRDLPDFAALELSGSVAAEVKPGENARIVLSGDDNILPLVTTEVRDGRLVVGFKPGQNVQARTPLKATITANRPLEAVELSGATTCRIEAPTAPAVKAGLSGATNLALPAFDATSLDLDASGTSTATAAGRVDTLKAGASGASKLRLAGLDARTADVNLSGASSGEIRASDELRGDASGASNLTILGKPPRGDVSKSGAASYTYQEGD